MRRHDPRRGVLAATLAAGLLSIGCGEHPSPTEAPSQPSTGAALAVATIGLVFAQVSVGTAHTCGITSTGKAYCWGRNFQGQLGDGTDSARLVPTPVAGNLVFRNISAGEDHTCGVTTDLLAYCWGEPISGKLGIGSPVRRIVTTPTRVAGGLKFRVVVAGSAHSCGLRGDYAYCWGDNSLGQLGDGTNTERDTPVPVAGGLRFRQVTAGAAHTCGVTQVDNHAYCWGWDDEGQLGDGATRQNRSRPSLVTGGHLFANISAGFVNTCAVTTTDQAFCWGHAPVGDGSTLTRFQPRAVAGTLRFTRTTAGNGHMCGEATSKKAYCWGQGLLGNGGNVIATKPVAVSGGLLFAQLSAGGSTCGKTGEGAAYCWGYNSDGQLGDGTTLPRFVPTPVASPQ